MSQYHSYKPFPSLDVLDPGIEVGWSFDVVALKAEPADRVGSILLGDATKEQEAGASTRWLIVDISPTAFMTQDWERTGLPRPFNPGDVGLTKRYPAGQEFIGNDGRTYKILKDQDFIGKLKANANVEVKAEAQSKAA